MQQAIVHVSLLVREHDEAIAFHVGTLGFRLVEDSPRPEQDKRWVVVAPPGSSGALLLLARASSPEQPYGIVVVFQVAVAHTTWERKNMSKVFVNVALSLDGYMAPEGMTLEYWDRPEYADWGAKWGALMAWIINQQYFRENLQFGEGGETGPVNDMVRHTMERTGANIMGKRMFEQGEIAWPEEAPFHTPVYVLAHEKRKPWVRPGGTTFHFVSDGPESALELAVESAGGRDIRISGGAEVIQQYLNLGVVDELEIALAPVLFGGGRRLFENLREPGPQLRIDSVLDGPAATHLRYVRR